SCIYLIDNSKHLVMRNNTYDLSHICCFRIINIRILIFFFLILRPPPKSTLFPTRRSSDLPTASCNCPSAERCHSDWPRARLSARSEEHTSELQSLRHLVCRLLLEKKKPFFQKHSIFPYI